MSNLSAFLAEDISDAALLLETQNRATVGMILWPTVSETIMTLRRIGRWLSDLEIHRAIRSGRITDRFRLRHYCDCWLVTIIGLDSEGELLGVILHLPTSRTEVLQITEVFFPPSKFQLGCGPE
jgi:hypothetical protein